jgi:hypothetical protein
MYTRILFPLPQSRTKQSDRFMEVTDREISTDRI